MPIIDVILLIILSGFIFYGLFYGLIRMFGLFVGLVIGAILASRFYLFVAGMIEPIFFGHNNIGKVATFILLFSLINRLVGFGFYLIEKAFNIISIIPFLKTINRLGGAALGFFTGSLTIGLFLFVISRYTLLNTFLGHWLDASSLAPMFLRFNDILLPLLPVMLKSLKSLI
ncbi:MAG: CvpA family protein [Patescibacteria group bacterium]|nr:CvpA family protein [Patescibacteria group bacterium]